MLLFANPTLNPLLSNFSNPDTAFVIPCNPHKLYTSPKLTPNSSLRRPLLPPVNSSSSLQNPNSLRHVSDNEDSAEASLVSSASAVASAIRGVSTSPIEFVQQIEKSPKNGLVLPSSDFQRLCVEQLDLFRRIVDPEAFLSVYVRPAGSYVMDRLELRRVTAYPGVNAADVVILVGSFGIPAGLRAAEALLSNQEVEFVPEYRAAVFPMVKHPFVVGFLVAEFRSLEMPTQGNGQSQKSEPQETAHGFSLDYDSKSWDIQSLKEESLKMGKFTAEQRSNAISIARSLAMAYVMDQKAMLLQQSSWQNNVRMSNLIEQIRGPLSSIRTLSKMLSLHTKRGEISNDIIEDILVQGDHMKDTLQQLQDAVHLTKANIFRYNEETMKKMLNSTFTYPESVRPHLSDEFSRDGSSNTIQSRGESLPLKTSLKDIEMPMPPPALAPLKQHEIRPCDVSDVLEDLVEAVSPLAQKQQRLVQLSELEQTLQVAIEEPALRQALSNLIEGALLRTKVGGRVEIVCMRAPAGGALVVIDDDGLDMHYMTQMHSLTPFGVDLCSENMVEDNMTWNFVAGLTVAREILESYGCVVRVISPRIKEAALGAGGTRIELWLPCFALSDFDGPAQML
ncbi:chloroplast sensor kinase, chloroplastic [Humulus lupulus]|uniref:chloroplast sensor kinase, chloroplastic n=1 Tax=Humulus lupulus TaxID=3486 RepID=UPI002B406F42|nr:chloroplast sensor kinase, chloroplastic [Humulus lupulus]